MKISIRFYLSSMLVVTAFVVRAQTVNFYGSERNDVYRLLQREGFTVKKSGTPGEAVAAAPDGAGVFIIAADYPKVDPKNVITQQLLDEAGKKRLRLYIEYPSQFPGLSIPAEAVETHLA